MIYYREGGLLWKAKRKVIKVSGSTLASVLHVSPWTSTRRLFEEKTGIISEKQARRRFESPGLKPILAHGVYYEDEALTKYKRHIHKPDTLVYKPGLRMSADNYFIGATPDAWCPESRTVVEIKCPHNIQGTRSWESRLYRDGNIPAYYISQCLLEAHVMGAQKIHFVCYLAAEWGEPWRMTVMEFQLPQELWDHWIQPKMNYFVQQCLGKKLPPPKRQANGLKKKWEKILTQGIEITNEWYFEGPLCN